MRLSAKEREHVVTRLSIVEGVKAAAMVSVFWLPPAYYYGFGPSPVAVKLQAKYPNYTVRTWFTIFPLLFAFLYESSEVASKLGGTGEQPPLQHGEQILPIYQRVAHFTFDHPLETLVGLSLPIVASTFHVQQLEPALTLAERVTHTNVIAQVKIFTVVASVLGLYRYLHFHDRFEHNVAAAATRKGEDDGK